MHGSSDTRASHTEKITSAKLAIFPESEKLNCFSSFKTMQLF